VSEKLTLYRSDTMLQSKNKVRRRMGRANRGEEKATLLIPRPLPQTHTHTHTHTTTTTTTTPTTLRAFSLFSEKEKGFCGGERQRWERNIIQQIHISLLNYILIRRIS